MPARTGRSLGAMKVILRRPAARSAPRCKAGGDPAWAALGRGRRRHVLRPNRPGPGCAGQPQATPFLCRLGPSLVFCHGVGSMRLTRALACCLSVGQSNPLKAEFIPSVFAVKHGCVEQGASKIYYPETIRTKSLWPHILTRISAAFQMRSSKSSASSSSLWRTVSMTNRC